MTAIQIPSSEQRSSRAKLHWARATTVLAAALPVAFASVGITTPAVAQEKMTAPAPAEAKPNFLFIMGDDIGWMQPSIYHRGVMVGETPNINPLARRAASSWTTLPCRVCTSGRNAFFTGMYENHPED